MTESHLTRGGELIYETSCGELSHEDYVALYTDPDSGEYVSPFAEIEKDPDAVLAEAICDKDADKASVALALGADPFREKITVDPYDEERTYETAQGTVSERDYYALTGREKGYSLETPLSVAILGGDSRVVGAIAVHARAISHREGDNPLDEHCCGRSEDGYDLSRMCTPIELASLTKNVEACEVLLKNGASPFFEAPTPEQLSILLAAGANPDARDAQHEMTQLHFCAESGDKASIRFLIDAGADLNARDKYGRMPENCARDGDVKSLLVSARESRELGQVAEPAVVAAEGRRRKL